MLAGVGIEALLFALAYRILPRVKIAWRDVAVGAVATAASFGAAGSLAIILAWVYYSSQIFLLGAEFTWVYAHSRGSRAGQMPAPAPPIPISPARKTA
jgi:membrane protein